MKIRVIKKKPTNLQKFFSAPLNFTQRVEKTQLLIMEKLLHCMKKMGLNRSKLAEEMNVSPAAVTKMLRGTNNFTISTLVKAADAVGCELSINLKPKGHEEIWVTYENDAQKTQFQPTLKQTLISPACFMSADVDLNELPSHAA